ncbi:MAG TPA: DUF882 domain-containing protein [Candidatus Binataceae bacterium]|nr:DUF882 domain-containing protein [Candidatus Binataceae bacterium]
MNHETEAGKGSIVTRRSFLRMGAIAAAQLAVPAVAMAGIRVMARRRVLSFHNLHTGENLSTTYWADGSYFPEELSRIDYILRDFRANEIKPIDRNLLDLLVRLHQKLGTSQPFQIISGYRSPKTNAMLHANSEGVAVHSLHIEGRAIDICIEGRSLETLRAAALSLHSGGVGYYPKSDFVHVDTGRIRWWGGPPPATRII